MQTLTLSKSPSSNSQPNGTMQTMMDNLRSAVGRKVVVEYVREGQVRTERKVLEGVEDYVDIKLHFNGTTTLSYPFVQWEAIRRVSSDEGEVGRILYENTRITQDYSPRSYLQVARAQISSFGINIAKRIRTELNGSVVRTLPGDIYALKRE